MATNYPCLLGKSGRFAASADEPEESHEMMAKNLGMDQLTAEMEMQKLPGGDSHEDLSRVSTAPSGDSPPGGSGTSMPAFSPTSSQLDADWDALMPMKVELPGGRWSRHPSSEASTRVESDKASRRFSTSSESDTAPRRPPGLPVPPPPPGLLPLDACMMERRWDEGPARSESALGPIGPKTPSRNFSPTSAADSNQWGNQDWPVRCGASVLSTVPDVPCPVAPPLSPLPASPWLWPCAAQGPPRPPRQNLSQLPPHFPQPLRQPLQMDQLAGQNTPHSLMNYAMDAHQRLHELSRQESPPQDSLNCWSDEQWPSQLPEEPEKLSNAALIAEDVLAGDSPISRSHRKRDRRFTCKFIFTGYDQQRDADFELVPRLIGRGGSNMRAIAEACEGKVRIRGRGSGHREMQKGGRGYQEADVPLQIALSCPDSPSLEVGKKRIGAFLQGITTHFERYCRRNGLDPAPQLYTVTDRA